MASTSGTFHKVILLLLGQVLPPVLQPCHSVVVDPQEGDLIEVLDTGKLYLASTLSFIVDVWYAAVISKLSWPFIKVHYEGWCKELWDEWLHVYEHAHRLRRFEPHAAQCGHQVSLSAWEGRRVTVFREWHQYARSGYFEPVCTSAVIVSL